MADVQCVILAGGLGTRMSRLTATTPKALIEVGGRPFLGWKLDNLRDNGITRVVISTGHLGDQIEDFVARRVPDGMAVTCVSDGPQLRGTAGALRRMVDLGLLDESFLLTFGDNYLTCDHRSVIHSFDRSRFDGLMTVWKVDDPAEPRNAVVEDGRVIAYDKGETSPAMEWVDYGLCILTRNAVVRLVPESGSVDLSTVFSELARQARLQAHEVMERYFEIGSESGLVQLEEYFRTRKTP